MVLQLCLQNSPSYRGKEILEMIVLRGKKFYNAMEGLFAIDFMPN
jgi:hypothetical protein